MLAAHILQSDVPLGLGFWAPFYSRYKAWKHLSGSDPEMYACIDGPQTQRTGYGIIGDLVRQGQWRAFEEDCHELYYQTLKPAQQVGILIDQPALQTFHEDLEAKQRRLLHEIQGCVPDSVRPLTGETAKEPVPGVLHTMARTHTLRGVPKVDAPDPIKQDLYALAAVRVKLEVTRVVNVCQTCGADRGGQEAPLQGCRRQDRQDRRAAGPARVAAGRALVLAGAVQPGLAPADARLPEGARPQTRQEQDHPRGLGRPRNAGAADEVHQGPLLQIQPRLPRGQEGGLHLRGADAAPRRRRPGRPAASDPHVPPLDRKAELCRAEHHQRRHRQRRQGESGCRVPTVRCGRSGLPTAGS